MFCEGLPRFSPAVQSNVIPSSFCLAMMRRKSSSLQALYSPTSSTLRYPASATFSSRCSKGRSRKTVQSITEIWKGACDNGGVATASNEGWLARPQAAATVPATFRVKVLRSIVSPWSKLGEMSVFYFLSASARTAPVEIPPSTNKVCPVMYRLDSAAKKTTAASRSRTSPGLFTGIRSLR